MYSFFLSINEIIAYYDDSSLGDNFNGDKLSYISLMYDININYWISCKNIFVFCVC